MNNLISNKITVGVAATMAVAAVTAAAVFAFVSADLSSNSANANANDREDAVAELELGFDDSDTGTAGDPPTVSIGTVAAPDGLGVSTADAFDGHSSDSAEVNRLSYQYGVPHHAMGDSYCGAGSFQANAPKDVRSVSGGDELVYWYPMLFKWTASGWQADSYFPWLRTVANGNGYVGPGGYGVWNALPVAGDPNRVPLYSQARWRTFTGLEAGAYYGVSQVFFWGNGSVSHEDWSGYCQVF